MDNDDDYDSTDEIEMRPLLGDHLSPSEASDAEEVKSLPEAREEVKSLLGDCPTPGYWNLKKIHDFANQVIWKYWVNISKIGVSLPNMVENEKDKAIVRWAITNGYGDYECYQFDKLEAKLGLEDKSWVNKISLYVKNTDKYFRMIEQFPNLARVHIYDHDYSRDHNFVDVSPLSKCPKLIQLRLDKCEPRGIASLSKLANLTAVCINHSELEDLSEFAGLVNVKKLDLSFNKITNISPLASLVNLESLTLNHNKIADLSPLAGLRKLTELNLMLTSVPNADGAYDISPLSGLTKLTKLNLFGNVDIKDVTPLFGLINLRELNIDCTEIYDVPFLSNNPRLSKVVQPGVRRFNRAPDVKKHQYLYTEGVDLRKEKKGIIQIPMNDSPDRNNDPIGYCRQAVLLHVYAHPNTLNGFRFRIVSDTDLPVTKLFSSVTNPPDHFEFERDKTNRDANTLQQIMDMNLVTLTQNVPKQVSFKTGSRRVMDSLESIHDYVEFSYEMSINHTTPCTLFVTPF